MDFISSSSSGKVMAVKRIRSTVDEKEQKQLLMDLEVVMKSSDCPFIVTFYGAIFQEGKKTILYTWVKRVCRKNFIQ